MGKKYSLVILAFLFNQYLFSQIPTISSFSPTSGSQYTNVIINGTNLTGTTAVSFGGTPANFFNIVTPTQINANVNTGSSGAVTVTTPAGTATLTGFTFLPPPAITSFSPAIGGYGTPVNIKGTGFTGASSVYFGGLAASSFTVLSDTGMIAIVGNGFSGSVAIVNENGYGSLAGFTYTGPLISSFTPTTGAIGTIVTLKGTNFSGTTQVSLGGIAALSFTVNSSTNITAVAGGAGSSGIISVTTPNGTGTILGFNIPNIYGFYPNSGATGTMVNFKGFNFTGTTAVSFGETRAASFTVLSDTSVNAEVGTGSNGIVSITSPKGTGTGQTFFYNYPIPVITSFTPTSGQAGTVITIKGTGFTGIYSVQTGGTNASSFTFVSDTVITAIIASGSSGNVSVFTPGGYGFLPGFIYKGPVISSFYPLTGIAGTKITIKGTNLSGATSVNFGGTSSTSFIVDSSTAISAIVANGTSGDITIITPFGTGTISGFKMVPVINSFTPLSGEIGTAVTINGANFDTIPSNNIVYFGAVKANVLSASATQIVATVPSGTTHEPVSVTTNNLAAYSNKPFDVTFLNGSAYFTANTFAPKIDYPLSGGAFGAIGTCISDLDGDGLPDLIVLKNISTIFSGFTVFRNSSHDGISFFDAGINLGYPLQNSSHIIITDLDGDGKPDIVITNGGGGTSFVSVYLNTSTTGNISLAPRVDFATGSNSEGVSAGDLDGDGKPDLVVANGNGTNTILILKNNSAPGIISFLPGVPIITGPLPNSVAISDLNGDGKPDLAVVNSFSDIVTVSVLKNTSITGTISFASQIDYPAGIGAYSIHIEDLEGDGKPDIIVANSALNNFSVLKNNGSNGTISFEGKVDYTTGSSPYGFSIGDLDGDGKPDIAVANNNDNTVSVFKNLSSGGTISFAPKVNYNSGDQPREVSIGDFNGDGRPDLVTPNWVSYNASILINRTGVPIETLLCPPFANTTLVSYLTGTNYQWQLNTGNGFINISNNGNYTGTKTDTLQLNNIPSSSYGYQYRCLTDGNSGDVYTLKFTDGWTGAVDSTWENPANWICGKVPDGNTDVIINSGTVVLGSNTAVRSIQINPGANFTVNTGFTLTITK